MYNLLLIEDNEVMRVLAQNTLKEYGLTAVASLKDAQAALQKTTFDLILLDIGLPDGDGLMFLNSLTAQGGSPTPVMIVSGKTDIASKVTAFSFGAEDFITKPFDPIELKARVSAKLKRIELTKSQSDTLKIGDLHITVSKQKVVIQNGGETLPVDLTTLEFKLLLSLAKHPERVYTREHLLSEVWGNDLSVTLRSVDTHVAHLRKKIHKSKVKIDTVIRSGYRLLINS